MDQIIKKDHFKVSEFAKLHGIPESRVRKMCESGELNAYRDGPGGHWYIRDRPDGSVTRAEFDAVVRENEKLKTKLQSIMMLCSG